MSIRLRQIALVANKLVPVIDDLKGVFGLEVCLRARPSRPNRISGDQLTICGTRFYLVPPNR